MPTVSEGSVYRRRGTRRWWIKFYLDGELQRESAGTADHEQAVAFLNQRLLEAMHGRYTGVAQRPTFEDMRQKLVANYQFKRNRTDALRHTIRLAEFFRGMRGDEIVEERIEAYCRRRLEQDGAAPATLRRELALLKRMLRLSANRLPRVPLIDMPRVDNARQGFFEEKDLQTILPHLAPHARNLVEFLYLTGWRSGEAFRLVWTDVDWDQQMVRLRHSKNREPRIFPFKYHPRLDGSAASAKRGLPLGAAERVPVSRGVSLEGKADPEAAPFMARCVSEGWHAGTAASRLSPHRGSQPDTSRGSAGHCHEDHGTQDRLDLPPLSDR